MAPLDRGEVSFFFVIWKFQVKKKSWSSSGLPGAVDVSSHSAPSRLHTPRQPPTCCSRGQKSIRSWERSWAQADKDFTRAGPESGFALKAVTCKWHCRKGSDTFFSRVFFHDTLKYWSPDTVPRRRDSHVPRFSKIHSQSPLCKTRKHLTHHPIGVQSQRPSSALPPNNPSKAPLVWGGRKGGREGKKGLHLIH